MQHHPGLVSLQSLAGQPGRAWRPGGKTFGAGLAFPCREQGGRARRRLKQREAAEGWYGAGQGILRRFPLLSFEPAAPVSLPVCAGGMDLTAASNLKSLCLMSPSLPLLRGVC